MCPAFNRLDNDSATKRRDPDGVWPTSVGGKLFRAKWFNHFRSANGRSRIPGVGAACRMGGAQRHPGRCWLVPDIAEPVIGRAFARPVGSSRLRSSPSLRANGSAQSGRPMTGSAKQSMSPRKERMDCFRLRSLSFGGQVVASLLAMTLIDLNTTFRSRGAMRPEFCISFALSEIRGRREDRARAAPAVSCAIVATRTRARAYRFSGEHPAFPAQWLYGLYEIVLVTLLFVTPSLSGSVGCLRT
jgi:hypothetical protein